MSNIFYDKADKAIEKAIGNASNAICRQDNLGNFDPPTKRSYDSYRKFFANGFAEVREKISENQEALDLIQYSATCGWLYGYSCAQEEALSTISAEDDEMSNQYHEDKKSGRYLSDAQENLTEESTVPESSLDHDIAESEEPEPADEGQIYQKPRRAKYLFIGIAIGVVITAIACIIIHRQMMG